MLPRFQSQSSYVHALRPFVHRTITIAASKRNLSITACKYESGGVQPKIAEDKQDSNKHQPRIEPKLGDRPPSGSNQDLERLDDWWFKYTKEQGQKKTAEIQNLTAALKGEKTKRLEVERRLRICCVIVDIVNEGRRGMCRDDRNFLTKLHRVVEEPEFTEIVRKEAQARGLVLEDVVACAKSIYPDLLSPVYRRNETFVIRDTDFTPGEHAALITLLKMQSEWPHPLSWREDVSWKANEGNV